MYDDPRPPYAGRVPRKSLAAALLLAAAVVPLLATVVGWERYLDSPLHLPVAVLAGYAVGLWWPRRWVAMAVPVAVAALVTANQIQGREYHWLDDLVFFLVVLGGPALAGATVAERARQVRRLRTLCTSLEEQEQADVTAARLEEQAWIQRQLHAGLAERIAGIALRARGARRTDHRDADSFAELEAASREVLDRLRAALGSLRNEVPDPQHQVAVPASTPARPSVADLALAAVLGAALAIEAVIGPTARGPAVANIVAALAVAAPLAFRRSRPVPAVGATLSLAVLMSLALTPLAETVTGIALMAVVFYAVGAWAGGGRVALGMAVAVLGTVAVGLVSVATGAMGLPEIGILLVCGSLAAGLGRITGDWHERLRRTREVMAQLEARRGATLRLARAQERQELASELHDTVAHAMTVVCLQAGAQQRAPGDPDAALETIAATATGALAELRDGLEAIEVAGHVLEPARIVELGRRMGVDVEVVVLAPVPPGPASALGLRVLREAIVNTARHAPGAGASVAVTSSEGVLGLEVLDDGSLCSSVVAGAGRGLTGLAEVLVGVGGGLEWGPRPTGGFRVAARIPEVPA